MSTTLAPDHDRSFTPPSDTRAVLISIQPRHVNKILARDKTVELRRTAPAVEPGTALILYSSSPVKAVVGLARLTRIEQKSPSRLWEESGSLSGISRSEFRTYFHGANDAFGLHLDCVTRARRAIPLSVVRQYGIEPPQSWRYLDPELAAGFSDLVRRTGR